MFLGDTQIADFQTLKIKLLKRQESDIKSRQRTEVEALDTAGIKRFEQQKLNRELLT
jgi:hypothetical protein